jgi:hypothetical protein
MGMERSYQAIPASCDLIERARNERELGEMLSLSCFYFRKSSEQHYGPPTTASVEFLRIIRALVAADPALSTRNHYLDRLWDQVRYLLSAKYRDEPATANDDLLDMAVAGEATIAEHVCGTQGYPVRYTSPNRVTEIAKALEQLDVDFLKRHYDLAAMERVGIYKAFAGRDSDEDWDCLGRLIVDLRRFYIDAAKHGDGVLVCTD